MQSANLPGFPEFPGTHLQSLGSARSSLVAALALCVPSAHPTHLSNRPEGARTRPYTTADRRARTKSCSTAWGSLFVLDLAVAANSRSYGPDGWREVQAVRSGRQLGLKQWPVKCQKWQGRAVVEQRGDHARTEPGALKTVPACSHSSFGRVSTQMTLLPNAH